jgi:hypothetical protein
MFDLEKTMKEHGGRCKDQEGRDVRIVCTDYIVDRYVEGLLILTMLSNGAEFASSRLITGNDRAFPDDFLTTLPDTKVSYVHLYCDAGSLGLPEFGVSRWSLKEAVESSDPGSLGIYKVSLKGDEPTFEKVEL